VKLPFKLSNFWYDLEVDFKVIILITEELKANEYRKFV